MAIIKKNPILIKEITDKVLCYLQAATSNGFEIQSAQVAIVLADEYSNKIRFEDCFKSYIVNNTEQLTQCETD